MKRVNVHLDEELDAELALEAARIGESKAALIRRAARAFLDRQRVDPVEDPWGAFTGAAVGTAAGEDHDDDVIYR